MNNTEAQPNLLGLAKQGNAQAIAALMNRQLQPKGITTKAALKDGCLQIMLKSTQAASQKGLVEFVRKGITNLNVTPIKRVKIYWHHTSDKSLGWCQEIEIESFLEEEQNCKTRQQQSTDLHDSPLVPGTPNQVSKQPELSEQPQTIKFFSNDFLNKKHAEMSLLLLRVLEKNKQASQAIVGLLCLVFLFGGCFYQFLKPISCQEAREAVQEAQNDYDANYQRQLDKNYVDTDTINSMYLKQAALSNAKDKLYEACNN